MELRGGPACDISLKMTDEPISARGGFWHRRVAAKAAAIGAACARRETLADGPRWVVITAIAVVAIVLLGVALDHASVGFARGLPDGWRDVAEFFSLVGQSHWYLAPTGVLVILLALGDWTRIAAGIRRGWAEIAALAAYVFLAVGVGAILVNLLKIVFGRGRPVLFDEQGWLTLDPWSVGYDFASFPSGHSTTAGALIVAGALIFPRLRIAFIALGLAIAFSRIIVGAHYPSDIAAGLALGGTVAWLLARFLARRGLGFAANPMRPSGEVGAAVRSEGAGPFLAAPFRALIG